LVAIKGQSSGQDVVNVVGIRKAFSTAQAVADAVAVAWTKTTGPLGQHPTTYTMVEVSAMFLGTADGEVFTRPTTGTGAITGALATNGSCALVTYSTGSRSKSRKGRMYHGPLTEAQVNADGRTLANSLTIRDAYRAFHQELEVNGYQWGVISRKLSQHNEFTSAQIQVSPVIATQRRRIR
jgi:hypothetical protein